MKPPAFQFYAGDFIAGTITMTHAERGLYILALCLQWDQGAISKEDLMSLAGNVPTLRVLTKFQDGSDGLLRNPRLEFERQKQNDYREAQSRKGVASGKARLNHGSTTVQPSGQPDGQPKGNSPSPSPSPSPVSKLQTPNSYSEGVSVLGHGNNGAGIEKAKTALSRAFKRGDDHWSYAEESSLLECVRRQRFHSELDELLIFRSQPKSFFPRSISRLLSDWQATLDRARNHVDESKPIKPATLMDKEAARQLEEAKRL